MADIDYSELEELTLNMEDENGVVTECELQFVFEYEDKDYGAFCEVDSDTGEFYFFVMNGKTNWKGEPELEIEPVEDEELLEQLVVVLQQIIDEEMNEDDEDDEPELEDDEDDSVWDKFIHKKLEE